MPHFLRAIIVLCILGFSFSASAQTDLSVTLPYTSTTPSTSAETPSTSTATSSFCRGFEEGYKLIKGKHAYVPYCRFQSYTPYGSTPFREGLKAGMKVANR